MVITTLWINYLKIHLIYIPKIRIKILVCYDLFMKVNVYPNQIIGETIEDDDTSDDEEGAKVNAL